MPEVQLSSTEPTNASNSASALENGNPSADGASADGDESSNPSADGASADVPVDLDILREMIAAGICYGRSQARTHPRMRPFIFATRNGIELIDAAETWRALERAQGAVATATAAGQTILVVGTQPAAQAAVLALALKSGFSYVVNRWLGGTLTNFKIISRRIEHFKKLKADRASGALEKYTKKERLGIDRTIEKMDALFRGIEQLGKLPGLMLVVNAHRHEAAVREAHRVGIPVIAIINTDFDPDAVEYPVPANDNSIASIAWLLAKIEAAAEEGKKEAAVTAANKVSEEAAAAETKEEAH